MKNIPNLRQSVENPDGWSVFGPEGQPVRMGRFAVVAFLNDRRVTGYGESPEEAAGDALARWAA